MLEAKLQEIRVSMSEERDLDALAMLRNEEASVLAQIEEAKKNEIVETAVSPDSRFVLAAGGYEADFRTLTKGEDEYQVASITTQLYLSKVESDHQATVNALNSEVATAQEKTRLIDEELEQTRQDLADVRNKLENATNQIADIEIERDGYKKEAESLRGQIEALRQQIDKPKIASNIDGMGALAEAAARIEAKKIPVYNVRSGDLRESFYFAQLSSTGEEIEIRPYYELKSKYRVVTPEEASLFRLPAEEESQALVESAETAEVVAPELQFQTEEEPEVREHVLDGKVAPEPAQTVSLEDRVAALEAAVFGNTEKVAA